MVLIIYLVGEYVFVHVAQLVSLAYIAYTLNLPCGIRAWNWQSLLTWNCRACLQQCEETGCVAQRCFPHCNFSSGGVSIDGPWFLQEPLYLQWKQWDCQSDCRYYCMVDRENEREAAGYGPVKYHGKWPFKRVYGIQVCFFTCYIPWQHFLLLILVL